MSIEKIIEITGVKFLQPSDFIPIFGVYNFASRTSEIMPVIDSRSIISFISRINIIASYNAAVAYGIYRVAESLLK